MKYFLAFLGVIALIVVVFVMIFHDFSGHKTTPTQAPLTDYATTVTQMRYTLEGPVTADQNYNAVRITIGRDANTIEILQGYQDQVIDAKTYPNNSDAYAVFLRSLQLQGYTKGDATPANADERGFCPNSQRYLYEIITGATEVQRYWRGACTAGTFKGNAATVQDLFTRQIPDYDSMTQNLDLGSSGF